MANVRDDLPKQIGPYRIIKRLGAGGMGTVYRAVHEQLHREVALKVLQPTVARNEAVLSRFRSEARASAMPAHENIVNLYENGEADGFHFLALEYVNGKDLLELIDAKGPLPVGFSIHVVRQAIRALQHANKHGFVHRDIKPSNFLITRDKLVKLTDMGLARKLEEMEDDRVTRDGTTVGTVDYMAPEQGRSSRDADIRSDIYSLGCTWYHMLTGETPYPGGTALERLYKHEREPTPNVRAKNEKVPEDIAKMIAKMMSKQPADRYQTPTELLEALDKLIAERRQAGSGHFSLTDTDSGTVPATPTPKPKTVTVEPAPAKGAMRWPLYLGSGIGLFVVIGAILFLANRTVPSTQPLIAQADPVAKPDDSIPEPAEPPTNGPAESPTITDTANEAPTRETPTPPTVTEKTPAAETPEAPEVTAPADSAPTNESSDPAQQPTDPPDTVEIPVVPVVEASEEKLDDDIVPKPKEEQEASGGGFSRMFSMAKLKEAEEKAPPEPATKKDGKKIERRRNNLGPAMPVLVPPPVSMLPPVSAEQKYYPLTDEEKSLVLGPWLTQADESAAPPEMTFQVGRAQIADENGIVAYNGLKPAWNDAQAKLAGKDITIPGWLAIHTNGPIFDGSHPFDGRPFVAKADPGFQPVLVYEEHKSVKDPRSWFEFLDVGSIEIEGVHFVIYADEITNPSNEFDLLRVVGSDLTLRRCSFTVLGRHNGINVVRILSGKRTDGAPLRVRFEDCVIRSEMATALTVDAANADVLIKNCCFVSRDKQILRVQSPDIQNTESRRNLRIVDSTLVSRSDILRVRVDGKREAALAVAVANSALVWNRGSAKRPMAQFDLFNGAANLGRVGWTTVKSVFVGWPALAAQSTAGQGVRLLAKDLETWDKIWPTPADNLLVVDDKAAGNLEADFLFLPYPLLAAGPWEFGPDLPQVNTGYDPQRCLDGSTDWFETSYGNFEPLIVGIKDPVRDFGEFGFTEAVQVNLAETSLAEVIRAHPDVTRLEVTVVGEGGEINVDPITLKGVTLILHFPVPRGLDRSPAYVLIPKGEGEALFDIDGGSLEVTNAAFQWPKTGPSPKRLARIKKGDLRLTGCRVKSSLLRDEDSVTELIRFEVDPDQKEEIQWRRLELTDTMLISSAPLVTLDAPAAAVVVYNCLLATQSDGFRILFGEKPIANWRGFLEVLKSTVSASDAAFHVYPYPSDAPLPSRPFVIAAGDTVFTDIIDSRLAGADKKRTGVVLSFEGETLARSIVAWQGAYNAYDKVLTRMIAPADKISPSIASGDNAWFEWLQVWGRRHDPFAMTRALAFKQKLKLDRVHPDCFAFTDDDVANLAASDGKFIGARISDFGGRTQVVGRVPPYRVPEEFQKTPIAKALFLGKETANAETKSSSTN